MNVYIQYRPLGLFWTKVFWENHSEYHSAPRKQTYGNIIYKQFSTCLIVNRFKITYGY